MTFKTGDLVQVVKSVAGGVNTTGVGYNGGYWVGEIAVVVEETTYNNCVVNFATRSRLTTSYRHSYLVKMEEIELITEVL